MIICFVSVKGLLFWCVYHLRPLHRFWTMLVVLCLPFANLQAQDPVYQQITKQNGLPSNDIYGIMQDSKGFVWLTTGDGLCRYDGFEYKTFYSKTLSSKGGNQPKQDAFGRIWYMNFDGRLYYIEKNKIQNFNTKSAANYSQYGIVGNQIWYASLNEINIFELKDLSLIKKIPMPAARGLAHGNTAFMVSSDEKNEILSINTRFETQKINTPVEIGYNTLMASDGVRFFHYSKNHENQQFLQIIVNGTITKKITLPTDRYIQSIRYTEDSTVWLCTPKGAYAYHSLSLQPKNDGKPYYENRSIAQILLDKEGNYWFCTTSEGILFVPALYSKKIEGIAGTPNRLTAAGQTLYIGTKQGSIFKVKNQQSEFILDYDNKAEIQQIYADTAGSKLFCTNGGSFNQWSMIQKKMLRTDKLAVKRVQRIDDTYLAYSASGVCGLMYNPIAKPSASVWDSLFSANKAVVNIAGFTGIIQNVRGKAIAFRKKTNTIFYGTNTGVYAVTPHKIWKIAVADTTFFPQNLIDNNDKIMGISTQGEIFEIDDNNQIRFLKHKIEPIEIIRIFGNTVILLGKNNFYTIDIRNTDTIQIIPSTVRTDNINDFILQNNELYIATSDGLLYYPFDVIKTTTVKPVLILNFLAQDSTQYAPTESPVFGYDENTIHINYSILSFRTQGNAPLYYRINGGKWRQMSLYSHTLSLDALAPNTYTIEFSFDQKTDIQRVNFTIKQPFWKQAWFIILIIGLFSVFSMESIRRRLQQKEAENQAVLERVQLENDLRQSMLTSIKAQMNPHFFYNALNTIQSYIYENDKRNAATFLNKFSKLTRLILEFSERETISLQEEIDALRLYLDIEMARFDPNDFEYNITISPNIDVEMDKIPSMIVQPYVENAVKHGLLHKKGLKKLNITIERIENLLYITIDDNGVGRQKSAAINRGRNDRPESFATRANSTRIALLNQNTENINVVYHDKIDAGHQATGTTVILCIQI
jgi:two-component sensor histidine kinase